VLELVGFGIPNEIVDEINVGDSGDSVAVAVHHIKG
jgi:hypothetical protein